MSATSRHVLMLGTTACIAAAVVVPSASLAFAADNAPQFLEREPVRINVDALRDNQSGLIATVEVVNPGPNRVSVRLRLTGDVSDSVIVEGAAAVIEPGESRAFGLRKGRIVKAAAGEIVMVSSAGVDRLAIAVYHSGRGQWILWAATGTCVLAAIIVFWLVLRFRRRRPTWHDILPGGFEPETINETLHSDEPTRTDGLNRQQYAEVLAKTAREAKPPLVVGVFGEWGSGKTQTSASRDKITVEIHVPATW